MFEWNAEEGRLINSYVPNEPFGFENAVSREDKIAFLDSRHDGLISYVLKLAEKFEEDKESMPKDNYGNIKTVSLNAWVRRNCTVPRLVDTEYRYGMVSIYGLVGTSGCRAIYNLNHKGAYDIYEDFVDQVFHNELNNLVIKEREYFRTHDEYAVCMDKIHTGLQNGSFYTFGTPLSFGSEGVYLLSQSGRFEPKRRLTLEEMKELLELNERVAEFVEDLKAENDIDFDNPKGELPKKKNLRYIER